MLCVVVAGFSFLAYGSESLILDCGNSYRFEEPDKLKQAPLGASRISARQLRVNWAEGYTDFSDEAPFDQPLEGISYSYCGYSVELDMHLIHLHNFGYFHGILIDNKSGQQLPAGEYVSFSADKESYFASAQTNGMDGEDWFVYNHEGKLVWSGYSGIVARHPDLGYEYFKMRFYQPEWTAENSLQATVERAGNHEDMKVVLTFVDGQWEWRPKQKN